jgi:hypothetical protein
MELAHTVKRNKDIIRRFRESNKAYLAYRKAYQKWHATLAQGEPSKLKELERQRDICAKRASESYQELGRLLKVLAWWWTFGE